MSSKYWRSTFIQTGVLNDNSPRRFPLSIALCAFVKYRSKSSAVRLALYHFEITIQTNAETINHAVLSYHLATGADDHQIKIWDLRYRKELYTLPAHNNLISTVKFEPNNGRFLLSSSFDNTIKVCTHVA
jgi:WD40 repeat protein